MLKKNLILCMLICLLVSLLIGCSSNQITQKKVTLDLTGFPYGSDTYHLKAYVEGDYGVQDSYQFDQVSGEFNKKIKVDEEATFIMVYLFKNKNDEEPEYFWRFDISSDKQTYETSYWLDYREFEQGVSEYGISKAKAKILETSLAREIDFKEKNYYLYKIPNVTSETWIDLKLVVNKGDININYAESLNALLDPNNYPTEVEADYNSTYMQTIKDYSYNQLYVLLDKETSGDINAALDIIINGQSPIKTIKNDVEETINFENNLYSIYEIPNMNANLINLNLEVTQGEAVFEYAESLDQLDGDSYDKTSVNVEGTYTDQVENAIKDYEKLYIRVKPANSNQETTANLTINFDKRTEINGKVVAMVADESNSELVYALDEDNNKLIYINSSTRSLTKEVSLADTSITTPEKMVYANNKLYIMGESSNTIEVWDINNESFNPVNFTGEPKDIAVDSNTGEIYILSSDGVFVRGNSQNYDSSITGNCIAFDETKANKRLFIVKNEDSPSEAVISKYDDTLASLGSNKKVSLGMYEEVENIFLSPDKSKLVLIKNDISTYTTDTFDLLTSWTYGDNDVSFSPDGSILYATEWWNDYLYVQEGSSNSLIRKLDFPYAGEDSVFTPTSDGSTVVGFSYDDSYDSDYVIYYFTDIKK